MGRRKEGKFIGSADPKNPYSILGIEQQYPPYLAGMNTYSDSSGQRYTKSQIDARVRKAKAEKKEILLIAHGYLFCERTGRTDCRLEFSHIISVDEAQKSGRVELAWDTNNLELLSRKAHEFIEKQSKVDRQRIYEIGFRRWAAEGQTSECQSSVAGQKVQDECL